VEARSASAKPRQATISFHPQNANTETSPIPTRTTDHTRISPRTRTRPCPSWLAWPRRLTYRKTPDFPRKGRRSTHLRSRRVSLTNDEAPLHEIPILTPFRPAREATPARIPRNHSVLATGSNLFLLFRSIPGSVPRIILPLSLFTHSYLIVLRLPSSLSLPPCILVDDHHFIARVITALSLSSRCISLLVTCRMYLFALRIS
jgi:hypothetical protein